jgi:hypothetical protein
MKRISTAGIVVVVMFALSAVAASSASAALPCYKIDAGGNGLYETRANCETVVNDKPTKEGWSHAEPVVRLGTGLWCAKLEAGQAEGNFSSQANCEAGTTGTGQWVRIWLHGFGSSTTGKLTSKALATQVFKTSAGNVECTALHLTSGTVETTKAMHQIVTVQYTGCTAFGSSATVSPAKYLFSADNRVNLLATITIKATACLATVPSAKNQNLETIKYSNTNKEIIIEPNVGGITSSGEGTACNYAEESKGTYTGNSLVALESGGTLEWE